MLPFRSFGTYGVWFPRGLLLHLAARGACQRILEEWQTATLDEHALIPDKPASLSLDGLPGSEPFEANPRVSAHDLLEAAQARVLSDADLLPDALANRTARSGGPSAGEQSA